MLIDYDKRLKPPEFYRGAQYPRESRFASDVWMIGTSFVAFLTGMDSLLTDIQYMEYLQSKQNPPLGTSYKNRKPAETWHEVVADQFRSTLLILNYR